MAIDTAEKRKSISFVVIVSPGVTSNVSKDVEWRQEAGYSYPVDLASPPALDIDLARYIIKIDDVGYNLNQDNLSWKIKHDNLSWNVRKD